MLFLLFPYNIFSVSRHFKRFSIVIASGSCFILKAKPTPPPTHKYNIHIYMCVCIHILIISSNYVLQVTTNTELANTEPLLLGEITGLGSCEPLLTFGELINT